MLCKTLHLPNIMYMVASLAHTAAARAHTSQGNLTANAPASYLERVDSPSSSVSDSLQRPWGTSTDLRPAISRSHLPPLICPFVRQIPQHTGGLIRNRLLVPLRNKWDANGNTLRFTGAPSGVANMLFGDFVNFGVIFPEIPSCPVKFAYQIAL